MSYTLVLCDSVRLRNKYCVRAGWRGLADCLLVVWEGRPPDFSWMSSPKPFDRVRAIGTDADMWAYASEYADFVGAQFGSYPRVTPADGEDRPEDYDAGAGEAGMRPAAKTFAELFAAAAAKKSADA